ncbi:hypothetical protein [PinkBerry-associated phage LS06-2018-MD08]|nr:hypothetical protein [PinkBerry-associated phage LS06-2018-MD08]
MFELEETLPKDLKCALDLKFERYTAQYGKDMAMLYIREAICDYLMEQGYGFLATQKLKKSWLEEYNESNNTT